MKSEYTVRISYIRSLKDSNNIVGYKAVLVKKQENLFGEVFGTTEEYHFFLSKEKEGFFFMDALNYANKKMMNQVRKDIKDCKTVVINKHEMIGF